MSEESIKKEEEKQVVKRLLTYLKKENDYFIQPSNIEPPDFLLIKKSNNKIILKVEVTNVDKEICEEIEKKLSYLRKKGQYPKVSYLKIKEGEPRDLFKESINEIIIRPIEEKSNKPNYTDNLKKDLILLLYGWHARKFFNEEEIEYIKENYRQFFQSTKFKEIWLVYFKISCLLYPEKSGI